MTTHRTVKIKAMDSKAWETILSQAHARGKSAAWYIERLVELHTRVRQTPYKSILHDVELGKVEF